MRDLRKGPLNRCVGRIHLPTERSARLRQVHAEAAIQVEEEMITMPTPHLQKFYIRCKGGEALCEVPARDISFLVDSKMGFSISERARNALVLQRRYV